MNINDYVSTNEEGGFTLDEKGFQSAFDAEIRKAVETYKNGKGRNELKKELEEEARLSAEDKLKKEREEFERYKLQTKIEINQTKARARLENKGFTDKEVSYLLKNITDNEEESLKEIDELIAERTAFIDNTRKNAIETLQSGQQKSGNPQLVKPDGDEPKKPVKRTTDDILNAYRTNRK